MASQYLALVQRNSVTEVFPRVLDVGGVGVDITERMHPDVVQSLVPCDGNVQAGWVYAHGEFSTPEPPAVNLLAYAADKRWRVETGGIMVGGVPVATDDRSKVMLMGARIKADAHPEYVVGWKGVDGSFVQLSAPQIIAISNAVLAHVDASFTAEAAVVAHISAGDITTTQKIDDWPWPA